MSAIYLDGNALRRFGVVVGAPESEILLDSLVSDTAVTHILLWLRLARNRSEMLAISLPLMDRITN